MVSQDDAAQGMDGAGNLIDLAEYDPEHRTYKLESGLVVPSVTTVINAVHSQPIFTQAIARNATREELQAAIKAATSFGQEMHTMTALYDLGGMRIVDSPPDLVPYLQDYERWKRACLVGGQWLYVEQPLLSVVYKTGGTLDRVGLIKGDTQPSLVDIKTGRIGRATGLQLAAYKAMLKEWLNVTCGRRLVLHMARGDAKHRCRPVEYTNPRDLDAFVWARNLYRHLSE